MSSMAMGRLVHVPLPATQLFFGKNKALLRGSKVHLIGIGDAACGQDCWNTASYADH